jgi:flagellar M-ring protein FliF
MAETLPQLMTRQVNDLASLPAQRQLSLLVGVAIVIAVVVVLGSWGLRPSYQVLLPGMTEKDRAEAMGVLSRHGISNRIDRDSGQLMVPSSSVHEARLHLATEGLPRSDSMGFELMDQDGGLGTSRLQETARYQRALEGELARSIMTINTVNSARVHLALPRQTVFMRDRVQPSASVLVDLHPGRTLDDVQIAGIVHMVASSVPEMTAERVTVLDQRGRLLSQNGNDSSSGNGQVSWQMDYTRRLEELYRSRVEDILAPLVGEGMRAQVTADVDFTQVERTQEQFDPDRQIVRSEQISEEESLSALAGGVPGALSNQPPAGGIALGATGEGVLSDEANSESQSAVPRNRSSRSTRNYELDRTISHIRQAPALLNRLSVAVVVDHKPGTDAEGQRVREPWAEAELEHMRALVMEAVGFNEDRGDRINLVNASFREVIEPESSFVAPAIWEEAWFQDLVKQVMTGLGILVLVLFVLRPMLRSLTQPRYAPGNVLPGGAMRQLPGAQGELQAAGPDGLPGQLPGPAGGRSLDDNLNVARGLSGDDPAVVAQVMRQWMKTDEK